MKYVDIREDPRVWATNAISVMPTSKLWTRTRCCGEL